MTTDFAICMSDFLTKYLSGIRDLSQNTVSAYGTMFALILRYVEAKCDFPPEDMTLDRFSEDFVFGFLKWLEDEKHSSPATRKLRMAGIHSFVRFLVTRDPVHLVEYQKILDMRVACHAQRAVGHLDKEQIAALVRKPDRTSRDGWRDTVMLGVMYDGALRVQEVCDIQIGDFRFEKPGCLKVTGKGTKTRTVDLLGSTIEAVIRLLTIENRLGVEHHPEPLFRNHQGRKFTRAGITYILKKYCRMLQKEEPTFPTKVSPHMIRHSKAMHLKKAEVGMIYIRDHLGHSDLSTTQIYAKSDTEARGEVIRAHSIDMFPELGDWRGNKSLMAFLRDVTKR